MSEIESIRKRYAQRKANTGTDCYSYRDAAVWQTVHERQRVIIDLFNDHGLPPLGGVTLVEVGAGSGGNLLEFLRMGFDAAHLKGIELLDARARIARRRLPSEVDVQCGDALSMDIAQSSIDIVFQSVVFSSILDDHFQGRLAQAMWSWLKPGGAILWYDFVYDNPKNKDVRAVPLRRIRQLFPEGRIDARKVTLAPPIARRVAALHPSFYTVFNALPILRTHVLCWISKP